MLIFKIVIKKIKDIFRNIFINYPNKKKLKNRNFTLVSSNCNGAFLSHDLNLKFNSPFVNLWMKPLDYIKYLKKIEYYSSLDIKFIKEEGISYPVGVLNDIYIYIYIYFQHYKTEEEARENWNKRVKRMNKENMFIMFTDRDGCTYENLKEFDRLEYKNKVVFCHKEYPELKSAFYIRGFEEEKEVGMCFLYKTIFSIKKYYDDFDYISWFNKI